MPTTHYRRSCHPCFSENFSGCLLSPVAPAWFPEQLLGSQDAAKLSLKLLLALSMLGVPKWTWVQWSLVTQLCEGD